MIDGHGDDTYRYKGIRSDFSSNICATGSHRAPQALMEHLASRPQLLSHYPEPEAWSLEAMLAELHGISPECVVVTSGATEAIYLIAQAFRYKPVIPAPTFREYEDACACHEPQADKTALWLCNPNNPDGKVYDVGFVERMAGEYDLVILDHSYEFYTNAKLTMTRWACTSPRFLQIHSFTKTYAVPGLRLGYITAHDSLAATIRRHLRPWSVSALAVEAGKYLFEHHDLICRPDLAEAQRLRRQLLASGVEVMPTHTNFMLCRLQHHTAAELKEHLASRHHMLIRDASNFRGLTPRHFRVAARTPDENDALVAAIQEYLLREQS